MTRNILVEQTSTTDEAVAMARRIQENLEELV